MCDIGWFSKYVGCSPHHSNQSIRTVIMLPLHIGGFHRNYILTMILCLKLHEFHNVITMVGTIRNRKIIHDQLMVIHHVLEVLEHLGREYLCHLCSLHLPKATLGKCLFQGDTCPLVKDTFMDQELLGQFCNPVSYSIEVQPLDVDVLTFSSLDLVYKIDYDLSLSEVNVSKCNCRRITRQTQSNPRK